MMREYMMAEGISIGERRGELSGERRGKSKGRGKMVLEMMDNGLPIDQAAKFSGFSLEDLEKLRAKRNK